MQEKPPTIRPEVLVSTGIERWVFNRTTTSLESLQRTLASALSPQVLITNGGYLFKASLHSSVFHFGLIPILREGERGYHYNIRLKHEDVYTLIGNLTTQRELSILFKNSAMKDPDKPIYQRVYQKLSQLFLAASLSPPISLDWITTHLLEEKQIFPQVPQTLAQLAEPL